MSQATHRIVGVGWGTSLNLIPAIAQLAEHLTVDSGSDQMVPGSIPGGRTFLALRLYAARGASLSCGWVRLEGRERESKHCHSGELISIMLTAYIEMHAGIQHVGGVGRRLPRFFVSKYDSLAEWSKALASGASPQGRGLEPHSCQCLRRAPAPSRLERSTDSAVHDWRAPLASASVASACTQWGWSALDMCECCSMPLEPCHCWFCCELKCNHRGIS